MRAVIVWSDKAPERDGVRPVCYDIAFKPDGTQLVAGVGNRVLVYDATDGDLLHTLRGHKDTVYCVAYSRDGKRFASGGADKTIIIWTSKAEGILKYSHNDSILSLSYNPVTQQLSSVTASDFGLWSPEQKSVAKHKVSSKVLSQAWTSDGQYLALGQFNGHISIRDKAGVEKVLIERTAPIWTIAWNPSPDEPYDVLAVGSWDGMLSYYQLSGVQIGKDKELGYDPCTLSFFSNGEYLCMGGSDRKVALCTKEGTRLTTIAERENWVWCGCPRPKQNFIAVGCEDGTIAMYQLIFSTVHGLYQDRYAYRDFMTDVIIQHLITEQKVRIKCRDYVKKIAVYKDRLAVQLPDRVIIYELANNDAYDMHYRVSTKIQKKLECNLLVVTSRHVILCQERKLQLYAFDGVKEREWVLDAIIRYIKVVGGPEGREGLLVGLKSGQIMKIFVDNPFPISLIKHSASIRCLDLSASRNKLAVVDENTSVFIYHLITKELLFEERNCNSVAWNSEFEDMFCFSGNGMLSIKTGEFPLHQQKLQGFVVGFKGSKIFCLHYVSMQTIDVPQGASLYRYVEKKDFEQAYRVACLGVTESDWRLLATEALSEMSLIIARKAFIRVRDMRYIELLNSIEAGQKAGQSQDIFRAQVAAYQGRYQDAAKLYAKGGMIKKAMEMFGDLRQFDAAKHWAEEYAKEAGDAGTMQDLINRQAEWSEEVNDYAAAADMYLKAKKYERAVSIIGQNNWFEKLVEVVSILEPTDTKALQMCAQFFRKGGQHQSAKDVYIKLQDHRSLIQLLVELGRWDEAFMLLKTHPELKDEVYLPRAKWLAANDKFDEARVAYREAGRPDRATRMLEQLTHNSVLQNSFADGAHYFFLLAIEALQEAKNPPHAMAYAERKAFERFQDCYDKCEIYYAYELIHRASSEAFTSIFPGTLFNAARFLLMRLMNRDAPMGVSMVKLVHTLAKQAEAMEAFKLARFAYGKLQGLKVSPEWQNDIDLAIILVRAQPFSDRDDLLPVCWRCGTTNAMLNPQGDFCFNCGNGFHRSFITFEHLPLVEFELEDGISDSEAVALLDEEPGKQPVQKAPKPKPPPSNGNADVLRLDELDEDVAEQMELMEDPWQGQMMIPNQPIRASRSMLRNLPRSEVLIRTWPNPNIPHQFFRVMDPDLPICVGPCGHFYEQDEYEMAALEKNEAPLCRMALDGQGEVAPPSDGAPVACFSAYTEMVSRK
eukprot:jgi/Tetstr1/435339/TSEL_024257.t1